MKKKMVLLSCCFVLLLLFTGCSKEEKTSKKETKQKYSDIAELFMKIDYKMTSKDVILAVKASKLEHRMSNVDEEKKNYDIAIDGTDKLLNTPVKLRIYIKNDKIVNDDFISENIRVREYGTLADTEKEQGKILMKIMDADWEKKEDESAVGEVLVKTKKEAIKKLEHGE